RTLDKLDTPSEIGESPKYDPKSQIGSKKGKGGGGNNRNFKGKRPQAKGGKKPWFKNKNKGNNSGNNSNSHNKPKPQN
ncbi:hypothetical protein N8085_06950, partial [Salibacteraceae bacterium]|nr:hypothetical protein [Salibacteraceae bacterium]